MKLLFTILLFALPTVIYPQYIRFDVTNLMAGPASGPWMLEYPQAENNFFVDDRDIFNGNYAYVSLGWSSAAVNPALCIGINAITESSCIEENSAQLNGINNVKLFLDGFSLAQFHHINTVDANLAWNIPGQAGDERVYVSGRGEIRVDGIAKLKATNCRISLRVCYPAPAGQGNIVSGSGWGEIDPASDDFWEAEFDPNNTGQVEFEFESFFPVIQGCYGSYNARIKIKPTQNRENLAAQQVFNGEEPYSTINLDYSDVLFNISSATQGSALKVNDLIAANKIERAPGGSLPATINAISDIYWQLGTTLSEFNMDVVFDVSSVRGVDNSNNLRILKRANSSADWVVYSDYNPADETQITANNVTSFSEFAIGSVGSDALPVELNLFRAELRIDKVMLSWVTETEVNNMGFEVEKKSAKKWLKIGFVEGHGNSNSRKFYEFIDNDLSDQGKHIYRLKQVDTDGTISYSSEVIVEVNQPLSYSLKQNFPNPFNPTTTIEYQLPSSGEVKLIVYDLLGREVSELVNEKQDVGKYSVQFNASGLTSGIYIYTLQAVSEDGTKNFSATRRLMLIK